MGFGLGPSTVSAIWILDCVTNGQVGDGGAEVDGEGDYT